METRSLFSLRLVEVDVILISGRNGATYGDALLFFKGTFYNIILSN